MYILYIYMYIYVYIYIGSIVGYPGENHPTHPKGTQLGCQPDACLLRATRLTPGRD